MPTEVRCPICNVAVPWVDTSRWRPFCSERCQQIDLGDWAAERHVIAGEAMTEESPGAPPAAPN